MSGYYLGIDVGTTLTTAVVMAEGGRVRAKASRPNASVYPQPGWVEQDPEKLYESCLAAADDALQKIPGAAASDLLGLGLDHQGETCLVWDKATGRPVYNAIVWQDRRTADVAQRLAQRMGTEIHRRAGVRPDAYHSATKLMWLMEHVPGVRERLARGELLLGTLNTWLFWKMTGGACYATDPASASCMMLMDLRTTDWDETLLAAALLRREQMPAIYDCNHVYGFTDPRCFLGVSIPIAGSLTDSPASLIGGGCGRTGVLKTSYGTGSFMSLITGGEAIISDKGLFSSCIWRLDGKPSYRLYGSAYAAGAAVEWLKNGMGIIESAGRTERMALSVEDSGDVYFVPALAGLATPYWDPYARGLFIGLTGGTTRAHLVRAVLESAAFQVADCYRAMRGEFGRDISAMRADGGMVENRFVMQFQADMLGIPVEVPEEKETAAYGAACLAAYTLGGLPNLECVAELVKLRCVYDPKMTADEREARMGRWLEAVERSRGWSRRG